MAPGRIRIDVDARTADLESLNRGFGRLEQNMRRAQSAATSLRGATRSMGYGAGGFGYGGFGGSGVYGGFGLGPAGQIGAAFGAASLVYAGVGLKDAIRFNASQLRTGAQLGVDPRTMQGFNASITGPMGLGARYGYRKDDLAAGFAGFAGDSDMMRAQREALYKNPRLMEEALKVFKTRGIDPALGMGAVGRFAKTFNLGPESSGVIAEAFAAGAEKSQLARSEDFVRFARDIAGQAAGMKGTPQGLAAVEAAFQNIAPRSMRGQLSHNLLSHVVGLIEQFQTHGGAGMPVSMQAMMRSTFPGGRIEAYNTPIEQGAAELLRRLLSAGSKYPEGARPSLYGGFMDFDPVSARLMAQMGSNPEAMRMLRQVEQGRFLNLADEQQRTNRDHAAMRRTKSFRAEATQVGVENLGYVTANYALDAFEGKLHTSAAALAVWTGMLVGSTILGNGGGALLGGVLRGGAARAGLGAAGSAAAGAAGGAGGGLLMRLLGRGATPTITAQSLGIGPGGFPIDRMQTITTELTRRQAASMAVRGLGDKAVWTGRALVGLEATAASAGGRLFLGLTRLLGPIGWTALALEGLAATTKAVDAAIKATEAKEAAAAEKAIQTLNPKADVRGNSVITGFDKYGRPIYGGFDEDTYKYGYTHENLAAAGKGMWGGIKGAANWVWGWGEGGRNREAWYHTVLGTQTPEERAAAAAQHRAKLGIFIDPDTGLSYYQRGKTAYQSKDANFYREGLYSDKNPDHRPQVNDNRTITIIVQNEEQAVKIASDITALAEKEYARSANEKDSADSGSFYGPESPRNLPFNNRAQSSRGMRE